MRSLKSRVLAAALAGAMMVAGAASAATVTATFNNVSPGGSATGSVFSNSGTFGGGIFKFTRTAGDAPSLLPSPDSPDTYFVGICLEFNESISEGSSHTWELKTLDQAPVDADNQPGMPMGVGKANQILLLLGNVLPNFQAASGLSNATAMALQIAIWEIVHETEEGSFTLATGNSRFTASTPGSAVGTAQAWLDNLNGGNAAGWVAASNIMALTKDGTQDFLVQVVPIPAAAWLLGSGLLGLFGLARRKKAAATA